MKDDRLPRLIRALQSPAVYDHPVEETAVVQTHISYVILTGPYAYKLKKPLDLGFLDFSTLERRKYFCEEELRLNRRLAPDLYVDVVTITGDESSPRLGGPGPPIEYAVKMVQFPRDQELDRILARGELTGEHLDQLAADVASFHERVAVADAESPFGGLAQVRLPVEQNFEQIRMCIREGPGSKQYQRLLDWSEATLEKNIKTFQERKAGGAIRECHGDMHLANMVLYRGNVTLFDCIEFNENLRWIDVISEVAFLLMDLDHRERPDLGRRFLNRYLEYSGDYAGLRVLPHYLVYRALVRAKVACILLQEREVAPEQRAHARDDFQLHLELAESYTRPRRTPLIITRGVSGTGKTTATERLLESLGAVRVRSDIERKRLLGLAWDARTDSGIAKGLYTAEVTHKTYARLRDLTRAIIEAGFSAIADATFLKHQQRQSFRELAKSLNVPFVILDFRAPEKIVRQRIEQRLAGGTDASEADLAVLEHQLGLQEPFTPEEQPYVVTVDTEKPIDIDMLTKQILSRS